MSSLPTGTVTFLFTDIQGSTKLALESPAIWESRRQRHQAIVQSAMAAYHGYVFQMIGDAFCASFHTAVDALQAAIKAQTDLQAEAWGDTPLKVRMGIHSGKADIQADGQYIGYAALSRAQRVASAGHGGQTLLSQAAQELVRDELPAGIRLRDLGEHRLKDLSHPEHLFQVDTPALAADFPALKTLAAGANNLPAQLTPFVGREREMAAVSGLLRQPGLRLVTLTGPGGIGKTRLSLQVAADLLDEYEHGIWFVELATITDPQRVLPKIAATLNLKESAGLSIEQLLHEYLAHRQLLLVMDNFEQVISAAPVLAGLLAVASKVKMLVSSREVLRLRGEQDFPVPPLALPESTRQRTAAVLAQYEAIALFMQHARAANAAFELDEANAGTVAAICAGLDGLPLAIELAAARSRLFQPQAMLAKLQSRLGVLIGGARDLPPRQQTIRGAIDWSYELLDAAEQVLFARLSVFHGGWTVEAAEAVCGAGLAVDVLSGLESLLDKSLVRPLAGLHGAPRFTMLATIGEYALEKLTQAGERPALRQAHLDYLAALIRAARQSANTPEETRWFAVLDDEYDNLRTAVAWAAARSQPAFIFQAVGLYDYWFRRGIFREPMDWLQLALASEAGPAGVERAWALKSVGALLFDTGGDQQLARTYMETALALFRAANDADGINRSLNGLGDLEVTQGHFDQARQFFEQSLVGLEADSFGRAMTLLNLGNLARIRGDWPSARDDYLRGRAMCERLGAESGVSYADSYLGRLAASQRQLDEAMACFSRLVNASWIRANPMVYGMVNGFPGYIHLLLGQRADAQRLLRVSLASLSEFIHQNRSGELLEYWLVLEGQARLESIDGRAARAAQLFGAAWTWRERDNAALTDAERPDYELAIEGARSVIGAAAFDDAFRQGRALTFAQAIAFALNDGAPDRSL